MSSFIVTLMSNIVAASLLAGLAYLCQRLRHVRVAHFLWLLCFIKLVTPPFVPVSLAEEMVFGETTTARRLPTMPGAVAANTPAHTQVVPTAPSSEAKDLPYFQHQVHESTSHTLVRKNPSAATQNHVSWSLWLCGLWGIGFALFAVRTIRELRAIRSLVRLATPALTCEFDSLARSLNLTKTPDVRIAPGSCPPFSFGLFRPKVVLPESLVGENALDAVLAHEFCHVRRRDNWHRLLESLCVSLFWWLPTVWIARKQLRLCEDILCDHQAQTVLRTTRAAYATAVVDVLAAPSPRPTPALATGFGHTSLLKRRIQMIVRPHRPRLFGTTLAIGFLACGLVVTPMAIELKADDDQNREAKKSKNDVPEAKASPKKQDSKRTDGPEKPKNNQNEPVEPARFLDPAKLPPPGVDPANIPKETLDQLKAMENATQALNRLQAKRIKAASELISVAKAAKTTDLKKIRDLAKKVEAADKALNAELKKMERMMRNAGPIVLPLPPGELPPPIDPNEVLPPGIDPNLLPPRVPEVP